MVQKRPFDEKELDEISSKLPKQLKSSDQPPLFSEINPSDDGPHVVDTEGEVLVKFAGDNVVNAPEGYEEETDYSDEDIQLDERLHVPFYPEYIYPDCGVRTTRHEDVYSLQLQHPPHKQVPIGSDYQADIPSWNPDCSKKSTTGCCSTSEVVSGYGNRELDGHTVIPMPDSDACQERVGAGRIACRCHDKGSIRCVRQHIVEARERLKRTIGSEEFEDLGFFDAGEQVAEKWTEEDEQVFHEVVFSNPPSIGRNFWNILSAAFPSRTKAEIVSYYFNVFMLRRRAEQNRFDPLNADSDNDEWRASDEDDDDSVVESPERHVGMHRILEDDVDEYDEGAPEHTYNDHENLEFEMGKKSCQDGQEDDIASKFDGKAWDERGDQEHQEAQDDSCTSFDHGAAPAPSGTQAKDENRYRWPGGYNGLTNSSSTHEYGLEPCDAKLWDVEYVSCPKREVDFLPTCSMIEEVFGDESWNCKMDGEGPSF